MRFLNRDSGRNTSDDPEEFRLTLIEHLEELRDRLIRSVTAIVIAWFIGWIIEPRLYVYLDNLVLASIKPVIGSHPFQQVFHQTTEAFMLKLRLSFFIGLGLALPYVIVQLWGFIAPGLKPNERRPFERLVPFMLLLFFMGAGFAWLIMPNALGWFAAYVNEFPGVGLNQEAGSMVFFILKMLLAFGVAFQLPLIVYGLGAIGALSAETLIQHWRHASVVIFILAAVITPSNDPMSMLMMAIPLVILFMISVWAVKFTQARKQKAAAQQEQGV